MHSERMRCYSIMVAVLLSLGCSSTNNDGGPVDMSARPDVSTADVAGSSDAAAQDVATARDTDDATFCETAECDGDTPVCSQLVEACVECASDTDCTTAPTLTCENSGVAGDDPTFTCVECVDDSVCAGGTCDLTTFTCM